MESINVTDLCMTHSALSSARITLPILAAAAAGSQGTGVSGVRASVKAGFGAAREREMAPMGVDLVVTDAPQYPSTRFIADGVHRSATGRPPV